MIAFVQSVTRRRHDSVCTVGEETAPLSVLPALSEIYLGFWFKLIEL